MDRFTNHFAASRTLEVITTKCLVSLFIDPKAFTGGCLQILTLHLSKEEQDVNMVLVRLETFAKGSYTFVAYNITK